MPETTGALATALEPAQAAELALLIDLEARWENLRTPRSRTTGEASTTQELHRKQKAYETFRAKLRAYNRRYAPEHVPEVLPNTPARLEQWCRRTRDLYRMAEHDPRVPCPVHLLEKAYRCADRLAAKLGKDPVARPAVPDTIAAALEGLEALAGWCVDLAAA